VKELRNDLPSGLGSIVGKALAKTLSARYQKVKDFEGDLKTFSIQQGTEKGEVQSVHGKSMPSKWFYRSVGLIVLVGMLVLAKMLSFKGSHEAIDSIAVLPFRNIFQMG
jgi:hypothetical protein